MAIVRMREGWDKIPKGSLILLAVAGLFLSGLCCYLSRPENNHCSMTYMFEYPEFMKISMPDEVRTRFPKYNLFAYSEGSHSVTTKQGRFTGHPVLFLPGNAGSYRQVRSIASIGHQMYKQAVKSYRFDFFSVDYDEEKAGLFGQVLDDQVTFAAQSIQRIQQLYSQNGRHNVTCVLMGHSIGGVVARSLLLHPDFTPSCISMLITLSAPLLQPVVRFDDTMTRFYEDSNKKWQEERVRNQSRISHIIHVSISGGFSDLLVPSQLALLPDNGVDVSVVTTAVPDVWLPMDHLCITWCKQFMVKISRMIYDVTDAGPLADVHILRRIVTYHLISRTRGKFFPPYLVPRSITCPSTGSWLLFTQRVTRYKSSGKILSPVYLLIRLVPRTTVFITLFGEHRHDWIASCNAYRDPVTNLSRCDQGTNLSPNTSLVPGNLNQPPVVTFKASADSLQATHILVSLTPQVESGDGSSVQPVSVIAERFPQDSRNIGIVLPSVFQSLTMLWSHVTILNVPVSRDSSYYNLSMFGLNQAWHAYSVVIRTGSCYDRADHSRPSIAHFHVPWSREDVFHRFENRKNSAANFILKLNAPRNVTDHRNASLTLYLDPDCSFKISLKFSFHQMMGQIVRFYYQYLIQYMVAIIVCIAGMQMKLCQSKSVLHTADDDDDDGSCQRLTEVLTGSTDLLVHHHDSVERIMRRRCFSVMMYGLLPIAPFLALWLCSLIPVPLSLPFKYIVSLHQNNLSDTQFILLFSTISVFAYGIVYVTVLIANAIMFSIEILVNLLHKDSRMPAKLSPVARTISVIPFLLSILLAVLAVFTTSAFGFLLTLSTHSVLTLVSYIKGSQVCRKRGLTVRATVHQVQLTVSFLLLLATMATFPLLLFWISRSCRLFLFFPKDQLPSIYDPHLAPCLIVIACMSLLWQGNSIGGSSGKATVIMVGIRVIGLLTATCCHNLFLLPHAVAAVLICIVINCLPISAHDHDFHQHQD